MYVPTKFAVHADLSLTDSRSPYNGTGTVVAGTNTAYYWPI